MYKETIISIVIIVFVLISNNIAQKHTDNTLGKTDEELYDLRSKIENVLTQKEKTTEQEIQEGIDKILEQWEKDYYVLAIYLEHDELEKVETELTSLEAHVDIEEYEKTRAIIKLMGKLSEAEKSAQENGWISSEDVSDILGVK